MSDIENMVSLMDALSNTIRKNGQRLASEVGVPYLKECEFDGPRGPRIERRLQDGGVAFETGPLLPGSVDNSPDCYLDVEKALARISSDTVIGVYGHVPSLNIVLVCLSGAKVGVRLISTRGLWSQLVEGVRARVEPSVGEA